MLRERTDRAWFSRIFDIKPGNRAGIFFQSRSPHGAGTLEIAVRGIFFSMPRTTNRDFSRIFTNWVKWHQWPLSTQRHMFALLQCVNIIIHRSVKYFVARKPQVWNWVCMYEKPHCCQATDVQISKYVLIKTLSPF